MKVIVGLGNPGKEYENTRHNAGFLAVDYLAKEWGFEDFKASKYQAVICEWVVAWEKVLLVKPTTYMNLSGKAVASLLQFYKTPVESVLVISDDIDMEFLKLRYRLGWSSGGQNGLKSIAEDLWTTEFARLKIGIGRDPRYEVSDWVLSKFTKDEIKQLRSETLRQVQEKVEAWLTLQP